MFQIIKKMYNIFWKICIQIFKINDYCTIVILKNLSLYIHISNIHIGNQPRSFSEATVDHSYPNSRMHHGKKRSNEMDTNYLVCLLIKGVREVTMQKDLHIFWMGC
uniref:Uncharacterized protein n=1 Tax=Octopus bimaculoides TaxID=37653 RepID=A0A0L8FG37_OCTBM